MRISVPSPVGQAVPSSPSYGLSHDRFWSVQLGRSLEFEICLRLLHSGGGLVSHECLGATSVQGSLCITGCTLSGGSWPGSDLTMPLQWPMLATRVAREAWQWHWRLFLAKGEPACAWLSPPYTFLASGIGSRLPQSSHPGSGGWSLLPGMFC